MSVLLDPATHVSAVLCKLIGSSIVVDPSLFDICCAPDVTFAAQRRVILFQVFQEEITDKSLRRPPYLGALLPDRGDS